MFNSKGSVVILRISKVYFGSQTKINNTIFFFYKIIRRATNKKGIEPHEINNILICYNIFEKS